MCPLVSNAAFAHAPVWWRPLFKSQSWTLWLRCPLHSTSTSSTNRAWVGPKPPSLDMRRGLIGRAQKRDRRILPQQLPVITMFDAQSEGQVPWVSGKEGKVSACLWKMLTRSWSIMKEEKENHHHHHLMSVTLTSCTSMRRRASVHASTSRMAASQQHYR